MGFVRTSVVYLLIASVLMAPLVAAQESCSSEAPVAVSAHADHGMSYDPGADSDGSLDEDCACCDQCLTPCAISGFSAGAVSAPQVEIDYPAEHRDVHASIARPGSPPPPPLFRPPISLA